MPQKQNQLSQPVQEAAQVIYFSPGEKEQTCAMAAVLADMGCRVHRISKRDDFLRCLRKLPLLHLAVLCVDDAATANALAAALRERFSLIELPILVLLPAHLTAACPQLLSRHVNDCVMQSIAPAECRARIHNLLYLRRQATALLHEAKYYHYEREKRGIAELLYNTTKSLISSIELDDVLGNILSLSVKIVGAETGSIFLLDNTGKIVKHILARKDLPHESKTLIINEVMEFGLAGWVLRTKRTGIVHDTSRDDRWRILAGDKQQIGSAIALPVIRRDEVLGILTLHHERANYFTAKHRDLLEGFAAQAATVIENARLYKKVKDMANRDALTGLYNRRYFFTAAVEIFTQQQAQGKPVSVIMIDIDHFKKVNDTYGHPAGDQVIKAVARRCRNKLSQTDLICRYGGEEFCILLANTPLEISAASVALRLKNAISSSGIKTIQGIVHTTISLGVAQNSAQATDLQQVLKLADDALLEAKQSGRDCIRTRA